MLENGSGAPFQDLWWPCCLGCIAIDYIEYTDSSVGRTCGQSFAIVVQLGIVDHVLMGRFDWD